MILLCFVALVSTNQIYLYSAKDGEQRHTYHSVGLSPEDHTWLDVRLRCVLSACVSPWGVISGFAWPSLGQISAQEVVVVVLFFKAFNEMQEEA